MFPMGRASPRSFYGFSQFVLSSGPLGQPLARRHRPSYMEVEVLDQRTERPIYVIDKVHPSSTVLDLKNRFHKARPGWYPSRTGLRVEPNGPFLQDSCVVRTLASSSLVTLYSTDLGQQVFLTQYFGPLLIYLMFYLHIWNPYDSSIKKRRPLVVHLACFCHSLHYVKHLLETLFVHRLSDGYTPLRNLLKGCAFYWGFTSWLGYYVNHPLYTPPYFANKQIIPSFFSFLLCEAGNFFINVALAQHSHTANSPPYPRATCNPFTWLFTVVHCPQYTYEIGAWISLAIMTQTVPVAVFATLVSIQKLLRARRRHHRRPKQSSGGGQCQAAVIPFLL
ncbi:trans-2,3-enoyl-CoA reductase-like isoform X2 [Brienomyrus brachyistius]|uniref:trans-2,3-enoyl-CoA reductase-like isoform X2 n=1 Tax=Brienomyrus brachyistius TaxID=42636 RepID=UPI0020B44E37|nr:trans-2,3-enoyl-CoA reductase-like isoform X2 [Brienomyrus brachyistius]